MSSKGKEVMEKLKRFDKGKSLADLMEALKSVDAKDINAELNQESFVDSEGKRIYYFVTEDMVKQAFASGRTGLNFEANTKQGMLKRFMNVVYGTLLLSGGVIGYLALILNKPLIVWLVAYYLIVEALRRAFFYIFYGKKFFTIK